ncbi:MAG: radical SAM protein [Alistipes sp.]
MNSKKLSKFSHIYEKNGRAMIYHSLRMVSEDITGLIYNAITNTLDNIDSSKEQLLLSNGFIVKDDDTDDNVLKDCRNKILEPYISTAYFFLTKNCNLACKYCFERQSETKNSSEGVMTFDVFLKGLDFFQRLINLDKTRFDERKTIIFYGGEPFHNKKLLFSAISEIQNRKNRGILPTQTKLLIVTNGTLMNDEDIEFIRENDVTITFSLDGDKYASANRVYPDGKTLAWDKATEIFKKCVAAGIDLNIACTLSPETIARQKEVLEYFISIGATNIGFNVILDNDIIQLDKDYDDAAAEFVTTSYKILSDNHITENRTRRRLNVFKHKHPCLFDCNAAGGRQIAIAPNGDVGICHEHIMDKKHFITTIDDMHFDPKESPEYRMWNKRSPLYIDSCLNCIALGVCGGGCVINSERKHNSIFIPDPRFCKQTILILKNILL